MLHCDFAERSRGKNRLMTPTFPSVSDRVGTCLCWRQSGQCPGLCVEAFTVAFLQAGAHCTNARTLINAVPTQKGKTHMAIKLYILQHRMPSSGVIMFILSRSWAELSSLPTVSHIARSEEFCADSLLAHSASLISSSLPNTCVPDAAWMVLGRHERHTYPRTGQRDCELHKNVP